MKEYHDRNSLSSGGYSDMVSGESRPIRRLGPFEYVATPPIQHLLNAILSYCRVGGSFAPGVRQLSEMSGVTLGLISGLLHELDRTGWISYDGHVIMVLRHPDVDQVTGDQLIADHVIAPSLIDDDESAYSASGSDDQNPDRSDRHMVLTTTRIYESESVAVTKNLPCAEKNDQRADHPPPAAQVMAELGANPRLIREAYESRPDWTPEQVRGRWEYDQRRIAVSDGKLNEGVFFTALRYGELAPVRPDPATPLDPLRYADDPAFRLGSDPPPPAESPRDRALSLLGPWTAENHQAQIRDSMFLQCRLASGDSDDEALAALAEYRSGVRR